MNDEQLLRYARHLLLDAVGIEGQNLWLGAHALVIGAGGLGSPVLMYLASAGIGQITVLDADAVDLTNLQRQVVHDTAHIGVNKAVSAKARMLAINPTVQVNAMEARADTNNLNTLVAAADVVLDCSDNFATRHAVNQACVKAGKPLVSGSAIGLDGQITVIDPRNPSSPCYACIFPPQDVPPEHRCATMGVLAPLVGIIGSMQATEALKCLAGVGTTLAGRLMMLDARSMVWTTLQVQRQAHCPVCSDIAAS